MAGYFNQEVFLPGSGQTLELACLNYVTWVLGAHLGRGAYLGVHACLGVYAQGFSYEWCPTGVPEGTSLALQALRPLVFHWRSHSGLPNVTCPRPGQCLAIPGWDYRVPCPLPTTWGLEVLGGRTFWVPAPKLGQLRRTPPRPQMPPGGPRGYYSQVPAHQTWVKSP